MRAKLDRLLSDFILRVNNKEESKSQEEKIAIAS